MGTHGRLGSGGGGGSSFHSGMRFLGTILFVVVMATLVVETLNLVEFQLAAKHLLTLVTASAARREAALIADTEPQVKGTPLRGAGADAYRNHVACFSQGRWVYDATPRYIPENLGDQNMGKCDLRWLNSTAGGVVGREANEIVANGSLSLWKVREDLKWRWETSPSCPFLPFEREDFCRQVGRDRNIMIVGDSLNQEIFYIFMSHLLPNISATGHKWPLRNDRDRQLRFKVCEDVLGGDGFYIGYVRNDRVSLILQYEGYLHNSKMVEWPWVPIVERWNTSILILNRGAHFEADGNYTEAVLNAFSIVKARFPDLLVFYRNTMLGHPNCSQIKGPLTQPLDYTQFPFHYGDFARQNELARALTHRFHHTYLDLATLLDLRPDGHHTPQDCLHYCLPGPLDVWMDYFHNVLRLINSPTLRSLSSSRETTARFMAAE